MSALAERLASQTVCTRCGAPLAPDQDWCLECGAAVRIRIRSAPDWRIPLAIVGVIVALAAAALVYVLVSLSNSANRSAAAAVAAAPAAKSPRTAAANPGPAATRTAAAAIASWPSGVTGYTVVLGVLPGRAAATASANRIAAAGIPVGRLYSSDYSSMIPGDWIVFSGTYKTRAQADAAASQVKAKGQTGAYAFPVVPAVH